MTCIAKGLVIAEETPCYECHLLFVPVGVELVPELLLAEVLVGCEAGHCPGARRPEAAHADWPVLDPQQPRAGVLGPGLASVLHCVGDHAGVGRNGEWPLVAHHSNFLVVAVLSNSI